MLGLTSARTLYGLSPYADSVRTQTAHFVSHSSAYVPERCLMPAYSLRIRGLIRGSIPLSSTIKRLVRRGSGKANGQKPKMYGHANRIDGQDKDSGKVPVLLDCCVLIAYSWCMTTSENTQRDVLARIKASVEGYTEGPWEVAANLPAWESEEGGFDVGPEDAPTVAVVEGLADAELIASAPKMLAALEAVEVELADLDAIQAENSSFFGGPNVTAGSVAKTLRSVIAKALA